MTVEQLRRLGNGIIPYQELLGNYDIVRCVVFHPIIIPYQELLGNYDCLSQRV